MIRAEHHQLAHETNMILINIRNTEINYFASFFGNFGIQAGVIIAILMSNMTILPNLDYYNNPFWSYLFW